MNQRLRWGHININVVDLDASIAFYEKLGFQVMMPGIPYLDLQAAQANTLPESPSQALDVPSQTTGRACIMQLGKGLPKLDLTEFSGLAQRAPLQNTDLGLVRLCLASEDLHGDFQRLQDEGVEFLSAPVQCHQRLADVAVCKDPDGTLIELLQVYLERWPRISR
ncbi:MAG: VOC family protein [Gammaproteobacteria bacterium]|jgi:catechol 2,3-dioxygenase-like lactoylglutathione lyase family enzyme